jgi:hypothetical protein
MTRQKQKSWTANSLVAVKWLLYSQMYLGTHCRDFVLLFFCPWPERESHDVFSKVLSIGFM